MRILHILSKDITPEQETRFLRLLGVLNAVSDKHSVLSAQLKGITVPLEKSNVPHEVQKFGGMFDLRTKKALQDIISTFKPHIIISHSEDSAAFTSTHIKDIPHIGMIDGGSADRYIASFCDHTIMMTEKQKDSDVLKNALARFETVLKRHEEKT